MAEPKQIKPAGCKGKGFGDKLEPYVKSSAWWAEEKFDGARYLAHVHRDTTFFTGRRISVKTGLFVDKTLNVPHINRAMTRSDLEGTIFDGEIVYPGAMVNSVTKIMGCVPDKAISRQQAFGWVWYMVFDIIQYKGKDVRQMSQEDRRTLLVDAYLHNFEDCPFIHISMMYTGLPIITLWKEIMERGGEGIVIKHRETPYGDGWVKVKKVLEDSVIVTGFTEGKGKYANMIGAIKFGQYDDGVLIKFGQCSGFDDATRQLLTDNQEETIGKVLDIKFQERFKSGKFREPRFLRFRPDLTPEDVIVKGI